MTTAAPEVDPLEVYESTPAVSFHEPNGGYPKGKWAMLTVRDYPELIQQRDDDGKPEFWDAEEGREPEPKLVLVIPVFDENGVAKNWWVKKMGKKWPDSAYQQMVKAQKQLRVDSGDPTRRLRPGDIIAAQYLEDDTSKPKIKGNYPKKYRTKIKPGELLVTPPADALAEESEDPWAASAPATVDSGFGAGATPRQPGGDPFGGAAPGEDDEPPF